jgi:hypothetical protein
LLRRNRGSDELTVGEEICDTPPNAKCKIKNEKWDGEDEQQRNEGAKVRNRFVPDGRAGAQALPENSCSFAKFVSKTSRICHQNVTQQKPVSIKILRLRTRVLNACVERVC